MKNLKYFIRDFSVNAILKLIYISLGLFLLPVLLPKEVPYFQYIDIILTSIATIILFIAITVSVVRMSGRGLK